MINLCSHMLPGGIKQVHKGNSGVDDEILQTRIVQADEVSMFPPPPAYSDLWSMILIKTL